MRNKEIKSVQHRSRVKALRKARLKNIQKKQKRKKKEKEEKERRNVPQRAPQNPPCSKKKFRRALEGTGGVLKEIARRLDTSRHQVKKYLNRTGWEDIRREWEEEKVRVKDLAEDAVAEAIEQRSDLDLATRNARWYLERKAKDRGYGEEVTIEGGEKPIRHQVEAVVLDAKDLKEMPLEQRKQMLEEIEAQKEEQKELAEAKTVEK